MSQGILIFAEQRDGKCPGVTLELISEGRRMADKLGGELMAVLMGSKVEGISPILAHYGADKIYLLDDPSLSNYNSDVYSQILTTIIKDKTPSIVLVGATSSGRDLAARLSARLDVGLASDCTKVN